MAGHGRPKGIPASKKQAKAGAKNLSRWQKEEGHGQQRRTHGVYSSTARKKFSDLRTTEGKMLQTVMDGIVSDLGGAEHINSAQQIIIAGLRSKLMIIYRISDYMDEQENIIDGKSGDLLPVLAGSFLRYTESARRDLESVFALNRNHLRRDVPRLEEIIRESRKG